MKKLIVIFSVLAIAGKVSAQPHVHDIVITKATNAQGTGKVSVHDIHITKATESTTKIGPGQVVFSGANMKEGVNDLTKVGTGTLQFLKSGNAISNVIFKDAAGNTIRLTPEPGATSNIPNGTWEIRANTKTGLYRLFGDPQ